LAQGTECAGALQAASFAPPHQTELFCFQARYLTLVAAPRPLQGLTCPPAHRVWLWELYEAVLACTGLPLARPLARTNRADGSCRGSRPRSQGECCTRRPRQRCTDAMPAGRSRAGYGPSRAVNVARGVLRHLYQEEIPADAKQRPFDALHQFR